MKSPEILKSIPKDGLLKLTKEEVELPVKKKIALIRKGNELFNQGNFEMAQKIFITADYADGLGRLGDHYLEQKKPLEAFRMYWLAKNKRKIETIIEKIAGIIKKWIKEER